MYVCVCVYITYISYTVHCIMYHLIFDIISTDNPQV